MLIRAVDLPDHRAVEAVRPWVSTQNFAVHPLGEPLQLIATALEHFAVLHNAKLSGAVADDQGIDSLWRSLRFLRAGRLTPASRHPGELRSRSVAGRVSIGVRGVGGDQIFDRQDLTALIDTRREEVETWVETLWNSRFIEVGGITVNIEDVAKVEENAPFCTSASGELVSDKGSKLTDLILGLPSYGRRWTVPKSSMDYRRHKISESTAAMATIQIPVASFDQLSKTALNHQMSVDHYAHVLLMKKAS